ncbi:MAG: hypothetical protein HRT71_13010 [Flavobacteriales bacterium]|nr:hypothetical protein [Flavobacteriales bacterium]
MAKYRLLSTKELNEMESEFVEYLILNGIAADDWEKMKKDENEKAEKIVDLFSDVVLEGVMQKIEYLELREKTEIKTFQCLKDKLVLVGMSAPKNSDADFTDPNFIKNSMTSPIAGLEVYTSDKKYTKDREQDIFEMINSGCSVSDGKLYKALCMAIPAK